MTGSTDWLSAIAILASGLILGVMFIYFVRRRPAAAPAEDLELQDLEAKRDVLVAELREPALTAEERTRLELETAQVLRKIDEHKKVARKSVARRPSGGVEGEPVARPAGNRAALIGFAWGVGSVILLGGLGYFVMQSAKSRGESDSVTGGGPMTTTGTMNAAQPQADPAVQQLEAAVAKSPDDLNTRMELAKAYLERDNLMGVFDQTQYVLAKSPNDSRALTYQALVRLAMGQADESQAMLERSAKIDPDLIDTWVALAWVKTQQGKAKEARAAIDTAAKRHPDEKPRLEQVYASMVQQHAQQANEPGMQRTEALPPGHPQIPAPGEGGMQSAAPAVAEGGAAGAIHITLEIDPSVGAKSGVLYVMARPDGVSGGPPLAVKRLTPGAFPMTVDLSSADSMMGQPLPPKVRVEARLDTDGDVTTHNPSDPHAVADGVVSGAKIKLALK